MRADSEGLFTRKVKDGGAERKAAHEPGGGALASDDGDVKRRHSVVGDESEAMLGESIAGN